MAEHRDCTGPPASDLAQEILCIVAGTLRGFLEECMHRHSDGTRFEGAGRPLEGMVSQLVSRGSWPL